MPEEEVVEAAPAEGVTATESATGEQHEPQEGDKPKGGFQKRIDTLTKQKADLARENEVLRQLALRTTPPVETPKATTDKEPSEGDFQTHAEYIKALTKYTAAQAVDEFKAQQRTEAAKTQQQTAAQQFQAKENAFREATPDFDEVMAEASDLTVSNAVLDEIVNSDHGPALKYFLAKNPDEAQRLSKLAPLALAREVGRIESRFTTSEQKTAPKTTAAPPPPNPTGKSSATSTKDPADMTPAEYKVWRAKQ